MKRAGGALLLGVMAVVLAGCGSGGSKSSATITATVPRAPAPAPAPTTTAQPKRPPATVRYEHQMQVLGNMLSDYFVTVGKANAKASTKQAAVNIRHVQAHLRKAAVQLAAMQTPTGARDGQQKLIAALREYASDLDGVIKGVKSGDRGALNSIPNLKGVIAMGKATTEIVKAGYDITGTGVPSK